MHKFLVNTMTLRFNLKPDGPILIKSSVEAGVDPTLPNMSFVRSAHPRTGESTVYLPGSSLKGVIRSRAEQIVNTLNVYCCDTLSRDNSCGSNIPGNLSGPETYQQLCTVCRIFGHMVMASRFYVSDAYPEQPVNVLPVRQMVAIDRRSGGSANTFDTEVSTAEVFPVTLTIRNFERWQVGLLALILRDIAQGTTRIGFGKSRGFGRVMLEYTGLKVTYPGKLTLASFTESDIYKLHGLGELLDEGIIASYGFMAESFSEYADWPDTVEAVDDYGQVELSVSDALSVEAVLSTQVPAWKMYVEAQRPS